MREQGRCHAGGLGMDTYAQNCRVTEGLFYLNGIIVICYLFNAKIVLAKM